mmetsp:Transcript_4173/g.8836  ORF Transcript_4173/g.8836 Transcript_4173/m.8836 type:complete len:142 (-) Transcript_4173:224-649(-)
MSSKNQSDPQRTKRGSATTSQNGNSNASTEEKAGPSWTVKIKPGTKIRSIVPTNTQPPRNDDENRLEQRRHKKEKDPFLFYSQPGRLDQLRFAEGSSGSEGEDEGDVERKTRLSTEVHSHHREIVRPYLREFRERDVQRED